MIIHLTLGHDRGEGIACQIRKEITFLKTIIVVWGYGLYLTVCKGLVLNYFGIAANLSLAVFLAQCPNHQNLQHFLVVIVKIKKDILL